MPDSKVRSLRTCSSLLLALAMPAAAAMPSEAGVPGGVKILRIAAAEDERPAAWLGSRRVLVTRGAEGWHAVVGLPLDLEPGTHRLRIDASGTTRTESFTVRPKDYPVQRLTIPDRRKVEPSAEDLARIRREQIVIDQAKFSWRDTDAVELGLVLPADGPLSSRFGLRRVLNGQARSPHAGLDLAIARGTPVHSAAAGVVSVIGDYFFTGRTVFVDHGQGLVTMYCHLDEISVRPGDPVARGEALGRSGMTGRTTGPHLHWGVLLNGAWVDPELFVSSPGRR